MSWEGECAVDIMCLYVCTLDRSDKKMYVITDHPTCPTPILELEPGPDSTVLVPLWYIPLQEVSCPVESQQSSIVSDIATTPHGEPAKRIR